MTPISVLLLLSLSAAFILISVPGTTAAGRDPCPKNMVYTTCRPSCVSTCSYRPDACIDMCDGAGCVCKKNYVFLDDTKRKCVRPEDCPKA